MELPVLSFELTVCPETRSDWDPGDVGCLLVVRYGKHEVAMYPHVASEYWLDRDITQVTAEAVQAWLAGLRGGVPAPKLHGWGWEPQGQTMGRWVPMVEK